jgi:hypothetical protein
MVGEVSYALRLPRELKVDLERWAQQERRSLNAQLVFLLEAAVERAEQSGELAPRPAASKPKRGRS